jgi:oxaloacetate decarboxylase alpha subunit
MLEPELEKYRAEAGDLAKCDEDVLSYALFPQVAGEFLKKRNAASDPAAVRELFVQDLT